MKNNIKILTCILLAVFVSSCTAWKKVTYLQTKKDTSKEQEIVLPSYALESSFRFQPEDILSIAVNNIGDPALAEDFNLPMVPITTETSRGFLSTSGSRQNFPIDREGYINFPVLGKLKAAGYTRVEFEEFLTEKIKELIPKGAIIVTVRLLSNAFFAAGEVGKPGRVEMMDKEHLNIMQALALAGDMSILGNRQNVMIMRENPDGTIRRVYIDLSDEKVISSPEFFIKPNDYIYVQPIKVRAQATDISPQLSIGMSIASFMMTFVSFVLIMSNR